MNWCRFADGDGARHGIVEDDRVTVVDGPPWNGATATGESRRLDQVTLLPPTIPSTFFCVGLNYRAHVEHVQRGGNPVAVPERPQIGYRANNALVGHGEAIVVPGDVRGPLEAEPEVAAVIGRPLRRASPDEAREAIFGWTIGNDVSARGWQREDRTFWRAKNCDTFKPMGPWIATDADPATATTTMRVNGHSVTRFATGDMIFDAVDYIVEITRYITMSPGDVIWMGADGTAEIAPGDTVEINVTGIGTLRNSVVSDHISTRAVRTTAYSEAR